MTSRGRVSITSDFDRPARLYVYGHVFVVMALLVAWGVVALPLLARLGGRPVQPGDRTSGRST